MDPHWIVNHECGLEEAKCLPRWRFFGSFADPRLGGHVVGEEEGDGVGVVLIRVVKEGSGCCYIIDDGGCIFEGIDADGVAATGLCCTGLDVVRPLQVPPEVEVGGEAFRRVQQGV